MPLIVELLFNRTFKTFQRLAIAVGAFCVCCDVHR